MLYLRVKGFWRSIGSTIQKIVEYLVFLSRIVSAAVLNASLPNALTLSYHFRMLSYPLIHVALGLQKIILSKFTMEYASSRSGYRSNTSLIRSFCVAVHLSPDTIREYLHRTSSSGSVSPLGKRSDTKALFFRIGFLLRLFFLRCLRLFSCLSLSPSLNCLRCSFCAFCASFLCFTGTWRTVRYSRIGNKVP